MTNTARITTGNFITTGTTLKHWRGKGLEALPLSLCRTPKESTKVEFINISPSLANAMLCEVHLRD